MGTLQLKEALFQCAQSLKDIKGNRGFDREQVLDAYRYTVFEEMLPTLLETIEEYAGGCAPVDLVTLSQKVLKLLEAQEKPKVLKD